MKIQTDESLEMWKRVVHRFMDDEIGVDYCREKYHNRDYPYELYERVVDNDWVGVLFPEEYGGQQGTHVEHCILLEALAKYGYDLAVPVSATVFSGLNILRYGTERQKEEYIPRAIDGDVRFTVGISEPEAGSDAASIQTRADRRGDEYVIDGEKMWQTGAHARDTVIVLYVRSDPEASKHEGLSTLLVPTDLDGIEMTKLPTIARKATGTNQVFFDRVRVPSQNLLGEEGMGWEIMTDHLAVERAHIAAAMLGNAQTAVDISVNYARDREQFGRSIGQFQAIKHMLAEMQTEVDAARGLVYQAASALDRGEDPKRKAAEAKYKAGEVFQWVTNRGMQIFGGASALPEYDIERYWREGKLSTVTGGTSEIQKTIIGNDILDR